MDNFVEYLVVAVVLLWSCWVVLRRFIPKTSFNVQQRLASWLSRIGLGWLGKQLMPKASQSGCSVGCSGCDMEKPSTKTTVTASNSQTENPQGCGTVNANQYSVQSQDTKEQPVQWRV